MTIKWGDPIECNGARPDWLRDDEPAEIENAPGEWLEWSGCVWHKFVTAVRLPSDHPAYAALAHGFHPWSGGESAPSDADLMNGALLRNGVELRGSVSTLRYNHEGNGGDIIGYRKRVEYGGSRSGGQPEWTRDDLYVRIVPFTRAEWDAVPDYTAWAQSVGLIRPETTAERFTRETGHAVTEAVEAALNWKES